MIQFGTARMILRDSTETPSMIELGYIQNGSVDFSFDKAVLFAGDKFFPLDIKYHSGQITGRGAFAKLNAVGFQYLIGGTRTGSDVAVTWTSQPPFWQLEFRLITDTITFKVTLNRCTAGRLSWDFSRDAYVIPEFEWSAYADTSTGDVATLELADTS